MRSKLWRTALLSAAVGATAVACGPPPGGGGGMVPSCPARQESVVSTSSDNLLRGLSANGDWVVTSNRGGPDLVLTLRSVDRSVPATPVTTLVGFDDSDEYARDMLRVGISDDGDQVVFEGQRWERSTGVVAPVTPPAPGATVRNYSADVARVAWTVPGEAAPIVTDAFTDAVLGWTGLADSSGFGLESRSGRFGYASGNLLVDHTDGSTVSFQGAVDAVHSMGTYNFVSPVAASDNGRFLLIESSFSSGGNPPSARRLWSWDVSTATLRELTGSFGTVQVADDGTAAWVNHAATPDGVRVSSPDGTVRAAHSGSRVVGTPWGLLGSADLDSIVFVAVSDPPFGVDQDVYASRCQ
jgi:hypothetical protein